MKVEKVQEGPGSVLCSVFVSLTITSRPAAGGHHRFLMSGRFHLQLRGRESVHCKDLSADLMRKNP